MSLRRRSAPACGSSVLVCLTADPGLIPQRGFSSKSTHLGNEPGLTSVAPPALCAWAALKIVEDCDSRMTFSRQDHRCLQHSHSRGRLLVFCAAPNGAPKFLLSTQTFRSGLTHFEPTALRYREVERMVLSTAFFVKF